MYICIPTCPHVRHCLDTCIFIRIHNFPYLFHDDSRAGAHERERLPDLNFQIQDSSRNRCDALIRLQQRMP